MSVSTRSILFICTGNTCRSQMAEGFARKLGWTAFSAGVEPESQVNSFAVRVMDEVGIDIAAQNPKTLESFLSQNLDYVITLCDHARETCPVFTGNAGKVLHRGFADPASTTGTDEEILQVYRKTRDDIYRWLKDFTHKIL